MRFKIISLLAITMLMASGCMSAGRVLTGTDTAVVGIYIDKNGFPQPSVDPVIVVPGQRIVFAGPADFEIQFKDQRSPIDALNVKSDDGIVRIDIPRDVLEKSARQNAATGADQRKPEEYRYGISANGKVTDPTVRIYPR